MMQKLVLIFLLFSCGLSAQELGQLTAIKVQKAYQLSQDDKLPLAIEILNSVDTTREYDKAFVSRMLGVFYWQNGSTHQAITQLETAVSSTLLENNMAWDTQRMLADLLLIEQKYPKALTHYYTLTKNIPEGKKEHLLWLRIAQAHYQLKQWHKTVLAVDRYIALQEIDEVASLSLRLGAGLELKKWTQAAVTLKKLIRLEPDQAKWWRQLASVQLTQNKQREALSTLTLAKLQGIELTQGDRRMLARLYARQGIPERAAIEMSLLDEADNNKQYLIEQASYWQQAKEWEKAISVWGKVAQLDSKYNWDLATLLIQEKKYQRALKALDKVNNKAAEVALTKARVYYKLGKSEQALIAAKKADNLQPSDQTKSWVKYLTQIRKASRNRDRHFKVPVLICLYAVSD